MLHARRPRRLAGPAFIFAAWALWLSFPYLAFGPASYVKVHDCGDSLLPALLSVARGGESWWFASGVCGADRLASALAGHLDLPLFLLLPGWLAYGLLIWTMRFLAGWSAFRLLADDLRLDPFPSFCGGILYALFPQSALNYSWNGFNIGEGPLLAAVPFCLWILHRADRLRPLAGAACAAGLGALIKQGVEFNKTMEDTKGGIAGVLLMTREYVDATGKVVTGQKAMSAAFAEASGIQEKLKKDALSTAASYTELVSAFQSSIGPASAAGVKNLDQLREITVMATQAMAALNIPTVQAAQIGRAHV